MTPCRVLLIGALALLPAAGCLLEASERCGEHMRVGPGDSCVCDEASVVVGHGCVPCPDGELVSAGACVCADGLVRDPESSACVATPTGQGVACDAMTSCRSSDDPVCAVDGYCTRTCAASTDCVGGYACDLAAAVPTCVRPPSGLRMACASQDDCAGYEASYCETAQSHVCLVSGCQVSADTCFVGWTCCDLTSFGIPTLCVPAGMCPT